ncbi:MAG: type I restriction-modification system subunit M [Methanosarcinaceae archaeon]|nr:type I restriction-modification system subunit M [Methanosarcinaceae archaeon]
MSNNNGDKSLEQWLWDAACSIRGAKEAAKYKDFILPLVFTKRLCDVFDDELNRIAKEVGGRDKAFKLVKRDKKLVRFYIPLKPTDPEQPVWSVIRKLADKIGEQLTDHLRAIARDNPKLQGIIDRVDFNATTHGQRDISDDRLSALIEQISLKLLGLDDVEPDIIGRSYEYLIRKFAEGSGQSAGEFYTPKEVGMIMARILEPEPGMEIYDPCCGSAGLLIKCEIVLDEQMSLRSRQKYAPLKIFGQEYIGTTWAMANMNMIIHDMEGVIEIGDSFKDPKFREKNKLKTFDRVIANPMWNQDWFNEKDYDVDELGRFPRDAGFPGRNADWGWVQHILASTNQTGKAAVILDTSALTRGSSVSNRSKEKNIRKWFIEQDVIEAVFLLPDDLFYNTPNAGIILLLNRNKKHPNKLLMVDLSSFYKRERPKNILTNETVDMATDIYLNWKTVQNVSSVVDTRIIEKEDYNLLASRYIHRTLEENWDLKTKEIVSLNLGVLKRTLLFHILAKYQKSSTNHSVASITKNPKFGLIKKKLGEVLHPSELRLKDIDNLDIPLLSLTKDSGIIIQSQRFSQISVVDDLSAYKVVRKGWIVYNPYVIWEGAIHALYDLELGIISPAYEVWIPQEVDYRYLDYILKTPRLLNEYVRLASGGVRRRRVVSVLDFQNIEVDVPDKKSSEILANLMKSLDLSLNGMIGQTIEKALTHLL